MREVFIQSIPVTESGPKELVAGAGGGDDLPSDPGGDLTRQEYEG
jgi:hypothetical protein